MEDDPNKSTDDIPSVHLQLDGPQIATNNADFSHIMHLPAEVGYMILGQLDFLSYYNLAHSCRRWFDIAFSAPPSIRPVLSIDKISVTDRGFEGECTFKYSHNVKKTRNVIVNKNIVVEKRFYWTMDTCYNWVRRIDCESFYVFNERIFGDLRAHLMEYANVYQIDGLVLYIHENLLNLIRQNSFYRVFHMFRKISIYFFSSCDTVPGLEPFLYNGEAIPCVRCLCDEHEPFLKKIVEDLFIGKLPKLEEFYCDLELQHCEGYPCRTVFKTVRLTSDGYGLDSYLNCLDSRRFSHSIEIEPSNHCKEYNFYLNLIKPSRSRF